MPWEWRIEEGQREGWSNVYWEGRERNHWGMDERVNRSFIGGGEEKEMRLRDERVDLAGKK